MKLFLLLMLLITTIFLVSCENNTKAQEKDFCKEVNCNYGKCEVKNDIATCICDLGYEGENCDSNIDDCANTPCLNNATCTDGLDSYKCKCVNGYSGENCEIEIDNCQENPCLNGGNCINQVNSYRCECEIGFSGLNCEFNLNNCSDLCQWGTVEDDKGYTITTDLNNNIYISGVTAQNLVSGGFIGEKDLFLIKINSDGDKVWTKQWGTSYKEEAYSMITDSNNNLYITGFTAGVLGDASFGGRDVFLIKFNSNGEKEWTKQWGSDADEYGNSITLDSNENIYITGSTEGQMDKVSTAQRRDIFLTKLNTDGVIEWTKQWDNEDTEKNNEWGKSLAIDSNDDIYITGYSGDYISGDIFLSKINSSGEQQWIQSWQSEDYDYGGAIAIDTHDNIYITGKIKDSSNGSLFLSKFNTDGIKAWTKQWGRKDGEGRSLAIDSNDNIFVLGTQNIDEIETNNNIYLAKFNTEGTIDWEKSWDKGGNDFGFSIAINKDDEIFITGFTDGGFEPYTNAGYLDIIFIAVEY